jgi:RNA polymerase sigma-70 factor (ECF subfamily)
MLSAFDPSPETAARPRDESLRLAATELNAWRERMSGVATEEHAQLELSDACYQEGRATFPHVAWSAVGFAEACRARWQAESARDLADRMGGPVGRAEEYLVLACLAGRPGAAATLDREYLIKLTPRLRTLCRSRDVADEALQALREKLLLPPTPRLAQYENRGQLAAWLTIVAVRTALDLTRRAQHSALRSTELNEQLVEHALSPESQFATRQLDAALRRALVGALERLPPEQRFALKMQLVAGWSIDQIGRALSTHRATAARWLVAARERLEQEVRATLVRELGFEPREVDGALGALRSRLDLRLSQFFHSSALDVEGGA